MTGMVPSAGEPITQWGLAIDAPLQLADPDSHDWSGEADMVVVGLGGAGIAAALQGLEEGLSVIALDQYEGGGSSAANGGVFYAGGGTAIWSSRIFCSQNSRSSLSRRAFDWRGL